MIQTFSNNNIYSVNMMFANAGNLKKVSDIVL